MIRTNVITTRTETGCAAPCVRRSRETDATRADGAARDEQPLPPQRRLQTDENRAKARPLGRQLGAAPFIKKMCFIAGRDRREGKGGNDKTFSQSVGE